MTSKIIDNSIAVIDQLIGTVETCQRRGVSVNIGDWIAKNGVARMGSAGAVEGLLMTFRMVTGAKAPSGFTDVPNWAKLGVDKRAAIRLERLRQFAAHLRAVKNGQKSPQAQAVPSTQPSVQTSEPKSRKRNIAAPKVAKAAPKTVKKTTVSSKPAPVTVVEKLAATNTFTNFDAALAASNAAERMVIEAGSSTVVLASALAQMFKRRFPNATHAAATAATNRVVAAYRAHSKANEGTPGFADMPKWNSMTAQQQRTLRVNRLHAFANFMRTQSA